MKILSHVESAIVCVLLTIAIVQGVANRIDRQRDQIFIEADKFLDRDGLCKEAGYKRNETEKTKYYRCVNLNGGKIKYAVFKFTCPIELEFDDKNLVCTTRKTCLKCNSSTMKPLITSEEGIKYLEGYHQFKIEKTFTQQQSDGGDLPTSTSAILWTDILAEPLILASTTSLDLISVPNMSILQPSTESYLSSTTVENI